MQKVNQIFVFTILAGILIPVMCTISSAKEFCGIQLAEDTKIISKDLKPMHNGLKARKIYDGAIDGRFTTFSRSRLILKTVPLNKY